MSSLLWCLQSMNPYNASYISMAQHKSLLDCLKFLFFYAVFILSFLHHDSVKEKARTWKILMSKPCYLTVWASYSTKITTRSEAAAQWHTNTKVVPFCHAALGKKMFCILEDINLDMNITYWDKENCLFLK